VCVVAWSAKSLGLRVSVGTEQGAETRACGTASVLHKSCDYHHFCWQSAQQRMRWNSRAAGLPRTGGGRLVGGRSVDSGVQTLPHIAAALKRLYISIQKSLTSKAPFLKFIISISFSQLRRYSSQFFESQPPWHHLLIF
jgi:hypothetical protein